MMKKQLSKKENKLYKNILSSAFIVLGTLIIISSYVNYIYLDFKNDIMINKFYQINQCDKYKQYNDYIAIFKIPKIGLERGIVHPFNINNNVDKNIEIINDFATFNSDITEKNLILAAHSGNADYSYFKNLYQLNLLDKMYLDYNCITYTYEIIDIYEVEKTGKVEINKKINSDILTLITCIRNDSQLVIIAKKI